MIPVTHLRGARIGVLGLGRSGLAAAAALQAGGARPIAWDDNPRARQRAREAGCAIADLTEGKAWSRVEGLIVSPGIPHLHPKPHPAVARAWGEGALVDNDVGLFFRAIEGRAARVVCVTGSNGKSTTTALIGHILESAGRPVQIGGNIGRGALDLDPPAEGDVIVLELSSYQIELARTLAPEIAVFLNLSDDHLERHGGRGGYFAAKRRLFEHGAPALSVIGVDEVEGRALANAIRTDADRGAGVTAISSARALKGRGTSVFAHDGSLIEWVGGAEAARLDLAPARALRGAHNWQNACAAWAAARALGLEAGEIAPAIASFPGLPHRLEEVAERAGVMFINDSKATNADAAEKALTSFERIRWIAGGRPKEGGVEPLAPHFSRVAKAYLIGEAAAEFAAALGDTPHEIVGDLDAAVARAAAEASAGEVVLLSPACASWDQFADYEERGERFRQAVARLARLAGPAS